MKNKIFILISICILNATNANCQTTETIFLESLGSFNKIAETARNLWTKYNAIDSTINKGKILDMTIELHSDISKVVIAKKSILNKIKNQPDYNINLKEEIKNLRESVSSLKKTLFKYDNLIKADMDAEILRSKLDGELSLKLDNLNYLKNQMFNNPDPKEIYITYLESGINILNGIQDVLEKFK